MPLTPFHLGPALCISLIFFPSLIIPAFLIGSIIVDVEPFLVLTFKLNLPVHGFCHTFLGGSIIAAILSVILIKINRSIQKVLHAIKLDQDSSFQGICIASFFGVYIHILLDSPLYMDIRPFFPLTINPFFIGSIVEGPIYMFCIITGAIGILQFLNLYKRNV